MLEINRSFKNPQYTIHFEKGVDYPNNIDNRVDVGFKDFSGKNGRYPYFTLKIKDDEIAQKLYDEGFNVKFKRVPDYILDDPDKDPEEYMYPNQLQINVNMNSLYSQNNMKVVLVYYTTDIDGNEVISNHVLLDKDSLASLDTLHIDRVDSIMFTGSHNDRHKRANGKTAYAQKLYLFVRKDPFMERYGF